MLDAVNPQLDSPMRSILPAALALSVTVTTAAEPRPFSADDVFELEWARSPVISPVLTEAGCARATTGAAIAPGARCG